MKKNIHYLEFLEMKVNLKLSVDELQDIHHAVSMWKTQSIINNHMGMYEALNKIDKKLIKKLDRLNEYYEKNKW